MFIFTLAEHISHTDDANRRGGYAQGNRSTLPLLILLRRKWHLDVNPLSYGRIDYQIDANWWRRKPPSRQLKPLHNIWTYLQSTTITFDKDTSSHTRTNYGRVRRVSKPYRIIYYFVCMLWFEMLVGKVTPVFILLQYLLLVDTIVFLILRGRSVSCLVKALLWPTILFHSIVFWPPTSSTSSGALQVRHHMLEDNHECRGGL